MNRFTPLLKLTRTMLPSWSIMTLQASMNAPGLSGVLVVNVRRIFSSLMLLVSFSDGGAHDLTVDCLRKFLRELQCPGVFVWGGLTFHEVLELLLQLLGWFVPIPEHYGGFDDLSSDRVGYACYSSLEYRRVRDQYTLDLERTYLVS